MNMLKCFVTNDKTRPSV